MASKEIAAMLDTLMGKNRNTEGFLLYHPPNIYSQELYVVVALASLWSGWGYPPSQMGG